MRCDNCGWDNASDKTHCIKCNTELETIAASAPAKKNEEHFSGTIKDGNVMPATYENDYPAKTIKENPSQAADKDVLIACTNPQCGYLYSPEADTCPRCKQSTGQTQTVKKATDTTVNQATHAGFSSQALSGIGTIDPYRKKITEPVSCFLKMIPKDKEDIKTADQVKEFVSNDEAIILNRNNVESGNNSITSKAQAELVFENGKWFLSDLSELHTTFINAGNKTEIKDGDLILMGDRKFIFCLKKDDHQNI